MLLKFLLCLSPNFEGYETEEKSSALSFLVSCLCFYEGKSLEAKIDGALAKSHCLTNLLLVFVLRSDGYGAAVKAPEPHNEKEKIAF